MPGKRARPVRREAARKRTSTPGTSPRGRPYPGREGDLPPRQGPGPLVDLLAPLERDRPGRLRLPGRRRCPRTCRPARPERPRRGRPRPPQQPRTSPPATGLDPSATPTRPRTPAVVVHLAPPPSTPRPPLPPPLARVRRHHTMIRKLSSSYLQLPCLRRPVERMLHGSGRI